MFQAAFYKSVRPGLQGIYSRGVQFIDKGPYSHCEAVFSDGLSASASWMDKGVRFKDVVYKPGHWDIIPLPLDMEDAARDWFEFNQGLPYDLLGNVRFVLPWADESPDGYFCSEALAAALGLREPWRFGPNGLAALLSSPTIFQPASAGFFLPGVAEGFA
ncbi:hypothetical protein PMI14_01329 [Acidovorax sp. CF316]|uniref:hypothetical protein n=1 Tax=Acidovorax sp. CF316 TaxID=1144317 RepID=UPI00026BC6B3|nr:hypothetical protein [Acidovorax sp. CF316]EJE53778.1 hypothetical protein PMI14_01329 [Acidovorax sp. CF316]